MGVIFAETVGRFLGLMAISGPGWILLMPAGPPAGPTLGAFTILGRTPCSDTVLVGENAGHAHQLAYRSSRFFPS